MKIRIFLLMLACCLLLCGCAGEEAASTPDTSAPEVTAAPTTEPSTDPATDNTDGNDAVPSLTVTEDPELTLPGFIWGDDSGGAIELPLDEFPFGEDDYAVPVTNPVTTAPVEETGEEANPPASTYHPGDVLPYDIWEDEE